MSKAESTPTNPNDNSSEQKKEAAELRSKQDSPWKDLLGSYFMLFVAYFFPKMYKDINWERGYEQLDSELANLRKGNATGKQLADKLIKVYLKSGKEVWLLIHIEVQSSRQSRFAERMYVYNYMIHNKYRHEVVSLAVLTDNDPSFRPTKYERKRWDFHLLFEYPIVKMLDYRGQEEKLEKESNPFAMVVLAHLKQLELTSITDGKARVRWKVELMRLLAGKGYTEEQVVKLFDFIDWLVAIPKDYIAAFEAQLRADEEVQRMAYVPSFAWVIEERMTKEATEKGLQQGQQEIVLRLLNRKLGQPLPTEVEEQVKQLSSDTLLELSDALLDFNTLEDLTNWLSQHQVQ